MLVRVQSAPFDPGETLTAFTGRQRGAGAIVSFTGITRDLDGQLVAMEIEQYPGMTQTALDRMAQEAQTRWDLDDVLIIHRHGTMSPGDIIMMVATAAKHRKAAFEAADFLMDYLKSRAPFWKKEVTQNGAHWVQAQESDEVALASWQR